MGPSCKRRTRPKSSSRRRTLNPKKNPNIQENSTPVMVDSPVDKSSRNDSSSEKIVMENNGIDKDFDVDVADTNSSCSTPKAERFRLPEIQTCPPAPKKRRILTTGCSFRRTSPVAFFASPDIELFFYFALRGIPV